jgi:hypothetical protein
VVNLYPDEPALFSTPSPGAVVSLIEPLEDALPNLPFLPAAALASLGRRLAAPSSQDADLPQTERGQAGVARLLRS